MCDVKENRKKRERDMIRNESRGFYRAQQAAQQGKGRGRCETGREKKLRLHIVLLHARIGSSPLLEPMGCHPPPPMRILNTASRLMMSS
jgi:hypothetical protein